MTQTSYLQGNIEEWNQKAEDTDNQIFKDFCIKRVTELEFQFDRYQLYGIDSDKMIVEEFE